MEIRFIYQYISYMCVIVYVHMFLYSMHVIICNCNYMYYVYVCEHAVLCMNGIGTCRSCRRRVSLNLTHHFNWDLR